MLSYLTVVQALITTQTRNETSLNQTEINYEMIKINIIYHENMDQTWAHCMNVTFYVA